RFRRRGAVLLLAAGRAELLPVAGDLGVPGLQLLLPVAGGHLQLADRVLGLAQGFLLPGHALLVGLELARDAVELLLQLVREAAQAVDLAEQRRCTCHEEASPTRRPSGT